MKKGGPFEIRDAVETDLAAIVAIYNASVPCRLAAADLDPISVESRLGWFRDRDFSRRPVLVAEADDKVLGWLSFQDFHGRPAYHATAELSVYVAPYARGCGVGKRLLEKAIALCPELGIKNLVGFIFAHNEPSLGLFSKFGFENLGTLSGGCRLRRCRSGFGDRGVAGGAVKLEMKKIH